MAHLPGGAASAVAEPSRMGRSHLRPSLPPNKGVVGGMGVSTRYPAGPEFSVQIPQVQGNPPFSTQALKGIVLGLLWGVGEVSVAQAGPSPPPWPLVPPTPQA